MQSGSIPGSVSLWVASMRKKCANVDLYVRGREVSARRRSFSFCKAAKADLFSKKNTSNDSIRPPLQFEHKATVILETFGPVDL